MKRLTFDWNKLMKGTSTVLDYLSQLSLGQIAVWVGFGGFLSVGKRWFCCCYIVFFINFPCFVFLCNFLFESKIITVPGVFLFYSKLFRFWLLLCKVPMFSWFFVAHYWVFLPKSNFIVILNVLTAILCLACKTLCFFIFRSCYLLVLILSRSLGCFT